MTAQVVLQFLVAAGVGSCLAPLIAALFNRGKVRAEKDQLEANATQVIAQAASDMTKSFAENYGALNATLVTELRQAKEALEETKADNRRITADNQQITGDNQRIMRELSALSGKFERAIELLEQHSIDVSSFR